jgi:hypothetical protein
MPAKLSRERVKRPIDETQCDWCGCPLSVGDRVLYDLPRGLAFCSQACAEHDAFDRGYGNGGTAATAAPGDD